MPIDGLPGGSWLERRGFRFRRRFGRIGPEIGRTRRGVDDRATFRVDDDPVVFTLGQCLPKDDALVGPEEDGIAVIDTQTPLRSEFGAGKAGERAVEESEDERSVTRLADGGGFADEARTQVDADGGRGAKDRQWRRRRVQVWAINAASDEQLADAVVHGRALGSGHLAATSEICAQRIDEIDARGRQQAIDNRGDGEIGGERWRRRRLGGDGIDRGLRARVSANECRELVAGRSGAEAIAGGAGIGLKRARNVSIARGKLGNTGESLEANLTVHHGSVRHTVTNFARRVAPHAKGRANGRAKGRANGRACRIGAS